MKCMKCGTSITSGQVFCDICLEDMAQHPVKPGTPIQLPNRSEKAIPKSNQKRVRKPEEQIASLRLLIFWLILVIAALSAALAITVSLLLSAQEQTPPVLPPGISITHTQEL